MLAPGLAAAVPLAFVLVTAQVTVAQHQIDKAWESWHAHQLSEHPLVGSIWSPQTKGPVQRHALGDALAQATHALIGEVHDNPDHHRLQAWGLYERARRGRRQVVVFEMIGAEQAAALDRFYEWAGIRPRAVHEDELRRVIEWDASGWPSWEIYRPVFAAALRAGERIVAGSPPIERTRTIGRDGFSALGSEERRGLGLDEEFSPDLDQALISDLQEGHCNLVPLSMLPPMALVQRFRDATMADRMLHAGGTAGGVLIAGNVHIRRDRGVAWYLERRGVKPEAVVSLALIEVEEGKTDAEAYVPRDHMGRPAVDFVWFTPRAARADPCKELKEQFDKKK
jgi:uncharacterized iron-regulated protein